MKKIIIILGLYLLPMTSFANVIISEVMYDLDGTDGGREWIEVYNDTSEAIDLSTWKLVENDADHGISYVEGEAILYANSYAIIADKPDLFKIDYPSFSGSLFDSTFSLSNSGEDLALKNQYDEVIESASYSPDLGASGDGFSLQISDGVFITGSPTPGEQNVNEPEVVEEDTEEDIASEDDIDESSHSAPVKLTNKKSPTILSVSAGRKRMASVHSKIKFSATDDATKGKVKFYWSYGDGHTGKGKEDEHVYKYPGTYNVILNAITNGDRAVSRTKVQVLEPELFIESEEDGVIIKNNSNSEVNIGEYIIEYKKQRFEIPIDTIISSKSSVRLSLEDLGFTEEENGKFVLRYPDKTLSAIETNYQNLISENQDDIRLQISDFCQKLQQENVTCSRQKLSNLFDIL